MSEKLQVSLSPHIRDKASTKKIMLTVILALLPAVICGVLFYGFYVLLVIGCCIATCVLSEYLYQKLTKRTVTIKDLSAVVTGLLIGLNMPPGINPIFPIVGSVFAIIVVKQLFGGIGQNFINPALGARCFMLISFSARMTDFTPKGGFITLYQVDALSSATPLTALKLGVSPELTNLFLGNIHGTIGETSALALLIGGIILLATKVIDFRIPLSYIGTFFCLVLVTAFFRDYDTPLYFSLCEVCAGGLMLGAWFMATDYATSPITPWGKVVFGVLLGLLTFIFRMVGKSDEGVSYAIILGNCMVPMIEYFTKPHAFGVPKKKKEAKE